jgi:hypothetical protein
MHHEKRQLSTVVPDLKTKNHREPRSGKETEKLAHRISG